MNVLTTYFCELFVTFCDFDLLACLQHHMTGEEFIRQQVLRERGVEQGILGWSIEGFDEGSGVYVPKDDEGRWLTTWEA